MKKYKIMNYVGSIAIIVLVICMSFSMMVTDQDGYVKYYTASGLAARTGMSPFEAMLNYEKIMESLDLSSGEDMTLATYDTTAHTKVVWHKIKNCYQNCIYLSFISILLCIVVIWVQRKRRQYQFFLWGGIGTLIANVVLPILFFIGKQQLVIHILQMLRGDMTGVFYDDSIMAGLLPMQWIIRNFFMFERNLFIGAMISIGIYFLLQQRAKPHKF